MATRIALYECGLHVVFDVTDSGKLALLHFSAAMFDDTTVTSEQKAAFDVVGLNVTGVGRDEHHGPKYTFTMPGMHLRYREHRDSRNRFGRKIEMVTEDDESGIEVTSHYQFYDTTQVVRCWTEVKNVKGKVENDGCGLEYVTSFALSGLAKEGLASRDDKMRLHLAHSSWTGELQWREYYLPELGLVHTNTHGAKRVSVTNSGSWSSSEWMPVAVLENREAGTSLFWQMEHNGPWHFEISDLADHLYLHLSGPTENEHHWWKNLLPGETFTTIPVAVGSTTEGFDGAMAELTKYRRKIRRPNEDNERLGVIFNDYMNCLWGDPTTEKILPLIDAAADAGCEYFCVDAGWYSDGPWWDGVGEWLPAKERFPGGIREVMDKIREKGMIPGLWLEIEVMGVKSPKLGETSDDWFFMRHGKRVIDRFRYQLDFRNPEVVRHANEVIDRLVNEYGVGYIKMDYNITAGIGTETNADSFGDGLLGHNRAYLAWIDSVFARYPSLIIENCSSGGMRMDYAMLSRHSIQSTSDQEDYRRYAVIAANAPTCVTPEQAAVWSYPLTEGDDEEVVFNMVNAMLLRIHQSGHLANITNRRRALVKEAIDYYKSIRSALRHATPFWPLGPAKFSDGWAALALANVPAHQAHALREQDDVAPDGSNERVVHIAVWRLEASSPTCSLPLRHLLGTDADVRCAYPSVPADTSWHWNGETGILTVRHPRENTARLYRIQY